MDKVIKQLEQNLNELKKSQSQEDQQNRKAYVLIDTRMKALCGVYLNEDDVINIIDTKHREDMKIEMDALRQKILNGDDQEYNSMILNCMETQLTSMIPIYPKHKIMGYHVGPICKSNYCYYTILFNEFNKTQFHFTNAKYELEKSVQK